LKYQIFTSSFICDKMIESRESDLPIVPSNSIYPFDEMQIGQSFSVPFSDSREKSLRTQVSLAIKRTGKKFKIIKHKELALFEVARLSDNYVTSLKQFKRDNQKA
jgi:hypothetical protein